MRIPALLLAGLLLSAPGAASAAPVEKAMLFNSLFPKGEDTQDGRKAVLRLPRLDAKFHVIAGSERPGPAIVSPLEVVRLDDDHAVLVTQAIVVSESGMPEQSHAVGAWLGAYFFERSGHQWRLISRTDGFDKQGVFGQVTAESGALRVERIAPHRFVLVLTNDSCWQGFCSAWLSVYEMGQKSVRTLVKSERVLAENMGASEACQSKLAGKKPQGELPSFDCVDIRGKYSLALGTDESPGELRIVFSGKQSKPGGAVQRVNETAIYRYGDHGYALIRGRNPVPGF
jgi:hypothetical protein